MPKILIIDDEKPIRNTLREILQYEKFDLVRLASVPSLGPVMALRESRKPKKADTIWSCATLKCQRWTGLKCLPVCWNTTPTFR